MRILAALTLLISASLSPLSTAAPLELKWTYRVNPNEFLTGGSITGFGYVSSNDAGGCLATMTIADPEAAEDRPYLFALNSDGTLIWQKEIPPGVLRIAMNTPDRIIYTIGPQYRSVCLLSGTEEELPIAATDSQSWEFSSRSRGSHNCIFFHNGSGTEVPETVLIQKWAPASPTPNLAPSTFGLEDGNLIISWPTDAGQTYQVQRSTDLESWENIGVALTGNGTTMSYSQPSNADKVFLRVVIP